MASIDVAIRPVRTEDLSAITAIYRDSVLHGTGTFEIDPPSVSEMAARQARILAKGYTYLVAESGGEVLGFAYTSSLRERPAFRPTVETSIYVRGDGRGKGIGRALIDALILQASAAGFRQMVAVIGDSENFGSIRLHEGAGFSHQGVMKAVGWKAGRWLDVVVMQRALGPGDTTPL